MIQEHMRQIAQYPHREVNSYFREFDTSFDPEPTPVYEPGKQVDW